MTDDERALLVKLTNIVSEGRGQEGQDLREWAEAILWDAEEAQEKS